MKRELAGRLAQLEVESVEKELIQADKEDLELEFSEFEKDIRLEARFHFISLVVTPNPNP